MDAGMEAVPKVPTITPQAAYDEMQAGQVTVLDVRPAEAYAEGHIEGALNIPLQELQSRAASGLPDKQARILVYCFVGVNAAYAVDYLIKAGYTNVASFGGLNTWSYGIVR